MTCPLLEEFILTSADTKIWLYIICAVNKWIAELIAKATKSMMEQKDERYVFCCLHFFSVVLQNYVNMELIFLVSCIVLHSHPLFDV